MYALPADIPRVVGASGDGVKMEGVTDVAIQVGGLEAQEWGIVTAHLPVPLILGAAYIDENVHMLSPKLRNIVLTNGTNAQLGQMTQSAQVVRCDENCIVPAQSVMYIPVVTAYHGLRLVTKGSNGKGVGILANVVDCPNSDVRMYLQYSNFSDVDLKAVKRQVLGEMKPAKTVAMTRVLEQAAKPCEETLDLSHLDAERKDEVLRTLQPFERLWSGKVGAISKTVHRIDTGSARPIHKMPHRDGPKAREEQKTEMRRMLAEGVIEPSEAEWSIPVVLVPNKDGSMRFCIYYRELNTLTKRDS